MKIIRIGNHYLDLHAPEERERVSSTALRSFIELMKEWEVADGEARVLLGRMTGEEFARMCAAPEAQVLDATQLKRIAGLLGIRRELLQLYGPAVASEWVQLPNSHPMFCSVKPITYMVIGGVQAMTNVLRLLTQRRRATYEKTADESASVSSPLPVPPPE
jgi:hypothetical protein